ncbi:MAG: KTSC domain-containing protein [Candidatus ainarchaeum sp.]|nr:KTSC domain-containing protein [Candidatus ainarchaeum sp.]
MLKTVTADIISGGIMKRIAVSSSDIASVGHSAEQEVLEIEFKNGGVYQYFRVPNKVYSELMAAESKGKYFHRYIRDKYTTVKV